MTPLSQKLLIRAPSIWNNMISPYLHFMLILFLPITSFSISSSQTSAGLYKLSNTLVSQLAIGQFLWILLFQRTLVMKGRRSSQKKGGNNQTCGKESRWFLQGRHDVFIVGDYKCYRWALGVVPLWSLLYKFINGMFIPWLVWLLKGRNYTGNSLQHPISYPLENISGYIYDYSLLYSFSEKSHHNFLRSLTGDVSIFWLILPTFTSFGILGN